METTENGKTLNIKKLKFRGELKMIQEPEIGDFAVCIDGHSGIVTAIKDSNYGRMIFIIEADGRVYHFPIDMLDEN